MANHTLHKILPDHPARFAITTFAQLTDHLFLAKYTAEQYPKLAADARRKLAKGEVAAALDKLKAAGKIIEDSQLVVFDKRPQASVLFDSSRDGAVLPAHYQRLAKSWRRGARTEISILYSPGSAWRLLKHLGSNDADMAAAELIASSIYFKLPAHEMETWVPTSTIQFGSTMYRQTPYGMRVFFRAGPSYRSSTAEIVVPIVEGGGNAAPHPDEETCFLDIFRFVLGKRNAETDGPLQIWMPDPEPGSR